MDFNHKHLILSVHNMKNPPRTKEIIEEWLLELVEAIDMKLLMGPYATRCDTPGNEGVTGIVVIETSHVSIHCWDTVEKPFLKADIYSCKNFNEWTVKNMFMRFEPESIDFIIIDRNNGNIVESTGNGVYR